jgi:hypothetical protein
MEPVREDEMKAYEPTMRERIASGLQSAFESLGANRYKARQRAQTITGGQSSNLPLGMGVADVVSAVSLPATMAMAPIYAEEGIRDIKSAGQAAGRGDYVGAGVEGLFGALNLLPAVSGVTGLARRAIGQPIKPPEIPDTPRITESPYETAQEGPFYRVKPRFAQEAGPKARGIREEVPAEPVGGPAGGDVPQPAQVDAKALIADPTNFVRRAADDYSQRALGRPYELPKMPKAALAKQSGIGRTFQLAASDDPTYKRSVFEAYGRQFPDIVEATGAQNYDQLMEAAYRQLAKETKDQFDTLPINMSFYRGGEGAYENSPQMLRDVYGNRHMYVYQGGQPHDFLNAMDPNTGLTANEMFRAVHDFYGHAVHGNPFGPKGEEIAYGAHSQMFSPLARMAMASETRGQNSFVNFTPLNAELMQRINRMNGVRYEAKRARDQKTVAEMDALLREAWGGFQFAPQKSLLLPPEYLDPQFTGGVPSYIQPLIKPEPGTTTAERLTHFSQSPELEALDPRRYGTGIAGEEMGRLKYTQNPVMERSYFYTGENPRPEPGLGPYRYGAESQGLYNLEDDPVRLRTLAAEANRTPYTSPYNQGITDPGQAVTDVERMAKEYGYEGVVNPQQRTAVMFNPTPVQRYQRGGAVKQKVKGALRQAIDILSPAERQANKAKFLEESKVQERLYHATPRDFSEFMPGGENPALSGPAIWMSPSATNQPAAHNIRTIPGKPGHVYRDPNMYTPGTNVMPLYSSIKNPLVATETTWKQDFKPFGGGSPWTMTAEEVQRMKEAGHDGILYYNKNGALEEVIAFEPQQVKSAIGNRGTYDPAERDITKARGGLAAIKRRK